MAYMDEAYLRRSFPNLMKEVDIAIAVANHIAREYKGPIESLHYKEERAAREEAVGRIATAVISKIGKEN